MSVATTLPPGTVQISADAATLPYWQAAREGRLLLARCAECGAFRVPPTPYCPECQSHAIDWTPSSGRGTVYTFSVVRGYPRLPDIVLVPVVVELPDAPGVKIVSTLVDIAVDDVRIGLEVAVDFRPVDEEWSMPVFRPAIPASEESP